MQERLRNLHIGVPSFRVPGWSYFIVVLDDVLVSAVKRNCERGARAAGCSLEARVARDHVVCQYSAVAPAANAETIGIRHAQTYDVVDTGQQILDFVMTPVSKD